MINGELGEIVPVSFGGALYNPPLVPDTSIKEHLVIVPLTIEIGPFTWRIIVDPNLRDEEDQSGQTNYRHLTLSIYSGLIPEQAQQTFWHEIVHCIDFTYLNRKLSEDEVAAISNGFYQVIKSLGVKMILPDKDVTK